MFSPISILSLLTFFVILHKQTGGKDDYFKELGQKHKEKL